MSKKDFKLDENQLREFKIKADIVPLVDADDEDFLMNAPVGQTNFAVLPLMDLMLFPGVVIPVVAQREKSRQLLHDVMQSHDQIAVFTQHDASDDPSIGSLYAIGVVANVLKVFNLRDDVVVAVLQGVCRCDSLQLTAEEPYMRGDVSLRPELTTGLNNATFKNHVNMVRRQYAKVMKGHLNDDELAPMVTGISGNRVFINFAATHLDVDNDAKFEMLRCDSYPERLECIHSHLRSLKEIDDLSKEIDEKTQQVLNRQQREFYLRHQMDVIQEELGGMPQGMGAPSDDLAQLRDRADKKHWPETVAALFNKEMQKMSRLSPMSSDYSVQLNYLETLLDLPWEEYSNGKFDLENARRVLDRDHYGIEKVKQRVLEYLAVQQRQSEGGRRQKAQVLCLVGPPGTGKTSVCRSIAAALGRPYRRIALGGLHDESEIRGHRRTYVGAMPGRILQEITKAGVSDPVFVLDEVDKVQSQSVNGDPSSALLEVLDPEQNCHFHDNFVNTDYDLSKVLFIATANNMQSIQPALLDRMEVIEFSGYVMEEKLEIAKRHITRSLLHDNVMDGRTLKFTDDALRLIVNDYTRESGVRQLEKQMAKIVRHRVLRLAEGKKDRATVGLDEVREVLGLPIHSDDKAPTEPREGVVTGLAWTPVGGEILFIEASLSHGRGAMSMTGNLGDVMKESATLAYEYIKANCEHFGIAPSTIDSCNLHIHVPEGATPKDGPSAGITLFTAMVSVLTHRKVKPGIAMTGEITLRGAVTPVGGIKEKILAAKRAGVSRIILCADNRRDVEDIEPLYINGLEFNYINSMAEVLPLALEG
ncbi:MAG: endopeptidase La [Bacteroidales bacterium]|nr:endopeptidase La [Bacteroidales bacterium]